MVIQRLEYLAKVVFVIVILTTAVLMPLAISTQPSLAQQDVSEPCSLDSSEICEPPTIREIQYLVTRIIYAAWAFGGIVFMVLLVVIGGIYLTSAGDQQKVETAKKRAGQWVVGLFLYFLAQPITATLMRGLVSSDASCFENLQDPGFTFFFPTVCDVEEIRTTPIISPSITLQPQPMPTDGVFPTGGSDGPQVCSELTTIYLALEGLTIDQVCSDIECPLTLGSRPELQQQLIDGEPSVEYVTNGARVIDGRRYTMSCICTSTLQENTGTCAHATIDPP